MSVIKAKRNLSDMEFFHNALELRKRVTLLLLRDFNVKGKVRSVNLFERMVNITEDDKKTLEPLLAKYNITSIIEDYPKWWIEEGRKTIIDCLRNLMTNIVYANSIYPQYETEYYDRRKYQNHAICACHTLLNEFQYIISVLPCDIEKYMPFVEMIDKEIMLLKAWRKSDNKILKYIKSKQSHNVSDNSKNVKENKSNPNIE